MDIEMILLLVVILALLITAGIFWVMGKKSEAIALINRAVVQVEESIKGTGQGQERFLQVINWVHDMLPPAAKIFITDDMIADWIEEMVEILNALTDADPTT